MASKARYGEGVGRSAASMEEGERRVRYGGGRRPWPSSAGAEPRQKDLESRIDRRMSEPGRVSSNFEVRGERGPVPHS